MKLPLKFRLWVKLQLLPRIASPLLKLLTFTWRVNRIGYRKLEEIPVERKIITVWHGRLLLTACILRNCDIHVMVSDHEDGELVTRIVERMGFRTVRGSSTRGGVKATIGAVEAISKGKPGGMLPDGPTGPRHKAKLGTVWLARETQANIVPVSGSGEKSWLFHRSWDKQLVPKFFSKVTFIVGEPLPLPGEGTDGLKQANRDLEKVLTEIESQSDISVNREPI